MLDAGIDHPSWWDAVIADLRNGVMVKDALGSRGLYEWDASYVRDRFPERAKEWDAALVAGRWRDIDALKDSIDLHVRFGATPLQAAMSHGMGRARWYHVLKKRHDVREHFQQLQAILPLPSEERYLVNWLLHALAKEREAAADATALMTLGALYEIAEAALTPEATLESVQDVVLRRAGLVLAHHEDMPAVVREAAGLEDDE